MKSPGAKAWCCVGIMMLGVVILMSSMALLNYKVLPVLVIILGAGCFLAGIILHYVWVRCPHCGSHLGRVYGPRCPFCGKDYNSKE